MSVDPILISGVLLLFLGWVVVPLAVRLTGFALGAVAGILLVDLLVFLIPEFHPRIGFLLVLVVVLGFLGMILAVRLLSFLFFLSGVLGAFVVKIRLDESMDLSARLAGGMWGAFPETIWFTLLVGLCGGMLLSLLKRYLIIALSAIAGATMVAAATPLQPKWLTLSVVGVFFQVGCTVVWSWRKKK